MRYHAVRGVRLWSELSVRYSLGGFAGVAAACRCPRATSIWYRAGAPMGGPAPWYNALRAYIFLYRDQRGA